MKRITDYVIWIIPFLIIHTIIHALYFLLALYEGPATFWKLLEEKEDS